MNIVIDAREIKVGLTGKGRYITELAKALLLIDTKNSYTFVGRESLPFQLPKNANFVRLEKILGSRYLWQKQFLAKTKPDIFFSPTGYHPLIFSPVPSVVVVHDLAVFVEPHAKPSFKGWLYEYAFARIAFLKAKRIIAVSNHTKKDIVRVFGVNPAKIDVTPLAPFERQVSPIRITRTLPSEYFLFVGTLEPRKNITGLIHSYRALPKQLRDRFSLIIVGKKGWNYEPIIKLLDANLGDKTIQWFDYVSDIELGYIFSHASAFVYPSFYEGFGLPPLEAMSYGIPVITSSTSSLPEVVGEAGILIDPKDGVGLTRALEQVMQDKRLRDKMGQASLKQVKKFSWEKTAEATLVTFNKVHQDD